jgi:ribosomal protein S20
VANTKSSYKRIEIAERNRLRTKRINQLLRH